MDTFRRNFQFPTLSNLYRISRFVSRCGFGALDFLHDVVAFEDFAKDNVTSIEPRRYNGGDEELGAC